MVKRNIGWMLSLVSRREPRPHGFVPGPVAVAIRLPPGRTCLVARHFTRVAFAPCPSFMPTRVRSSLSANLCAQLPFADSSPGRVSSLLLRSARGRRRRRRRRRCGGQGGESFWLAVEFMRHVVVLFRWFHRSRI